MAPVEEMSSIMSLIRDVKPLALAAFCSAPAAPASRCSRRRPSFGIRVNLMMLGISSIGIKGTCQIGFRDLEGPLVPKWRESHLVHCRSSKLLSAPRPPAAPSGTNLNRGPEAIQVQLSNIIRDNSFSMPRKSANKLCRVSSYVRNLAR
jgi:hypothetical protein